jgi:hypothetical protein
MVFSFASDRLYFVTEKCLPPPAENSFSRQILILAVLSPEDAAEEAFLKKILAAVGLDLHKDTFFVPISSKDTIRIAPFLRREQPRAVLVFGAEPSALGFQTERIDYRPIAFYGTTFLWADALSVLEGDLERKRRLWNALKEIFNTAFHP